MLPLRSGREYCLVTLVPGLFLARVSAFAADVDPIATHVPPIGGI